MVIVTLEGVAMKFTVRSIRNLRLSLQFVLSELTNLVVKRSEILLDLITIVLCFVSHIESRLIYTRIHAPISFKHV